MHSGNYPNKPPAPPISPWESNATLREAFQANGIRITKLDADSLPEIKSLMQKNKADEGFHEMATETLTGMKFDKIISGDSSDKCLLARQIFTNKIIGFVIFGEGGTETCGAIDSIGVDNDFRFSNKQASSNQPRHVGTCLLLAACNELYQLPNITQIGVMISDDEAALFYRKFEFAVDTDDPDELYQSIKDYPLMEHYLAAKTKSQSAPTYSLNKTTEMAPVLDDDASKTIEQSATQTKKIS